MPKRVVAKKVPIVVYLTPLEKTSFHQSAWKRQLTDSELARTLLLRFLDKEGQPTTATPQHTAPRPPKAEVPAHAPIFDTLDGLVDDETE